MGPRGRRFGDDLSMNASDLRQPGTAIILTGASSTGKTSIAQQLRLELSRPTVVLVGDDFDIPPSSKAMKVLQELPPAEIAGLEDQFHSGLYGAIAGFARAGLHSVGEVVFKSPTHLDLFEAATENLPRLVVRVRCELDVRRAREAARADRAPGLAEVTASQEWVPPSADLVIDTSDLDARSAALMVVNRVEEA